MSDKAKVLATTTSGIGSNSVDLVEQDGAVFTRRPDGTTYPSGTITADFARQLYEANQIIETLPMNRNGDRVTLGSSWWIKRVEDCCEHEDSCEHSIWSQALVTELRHERDTVEVLGGGHRYVVKTDQLFKRPELKEKKEEITLIIDAAEKAIKDLREKLEERTEWLRRQIKKLHNRFDHPY